MKLGEFPTQLLYTLGIPHCINGQLWTTKKIHTRDAYTCAHHYISEQQDCHSFNMLHFQK